MIITELILNTGYPEDLKRFYENILGLKVIMGNENSFTVQTGSSDLRFVKSDPDKKPFYHFAFNIPENQLGEAKIWVKEIADLITLNGEDEFDFKAWNAHSIYFYDPAGNILEFIARHDLNNRSGEKFSGSSILNISEIGLPVKDVENFYSEVNSKFDIPIFSGDTSSFCAAGDDNGLFIIVNNGRVWFPNCGKADIFPTTVKIRSKNKREITFGKLPYILVSNYLEQGT